MIEVTPNGSWKADADDYGIDRSLAYGIADHLLSSGVKSVLDLGCGNGEYVKIMSRRGLDARGVDGNEKASEFCKFCSTADITNPLKLDRTFDAVISLEVGEHIPKDLEIGFIFNLVRQNPKQIILSWFPYEGEGVGHVNPKPNHEVKKIMSMLGYISDDQVEIKLRTVATRWWFKISLLAFRFK